MDLYVLLQILFLMDWGAFDPPEEADLNRFSLDAATSAAGASSSRASRWDLILAARSDQSIPDCTCLFEVEPQPPQSREGGSASEPSVQAPAIEAIHLAAPGDDELLALPNASSSMSGMRDHFPTTFFAVENIMQPNRKRGYRLLGWFTITHVERALTCREVRAEISSTRAGGALAPPSGPLGPP